MIVNGVHVPALLAWLFAALAVAGWWRMGNRAYDAAVWVWERWQDRRGGGDDQGDDDPDLDDDRDPVAEADTELELPPERDWAEITTDWARESREYLYDARDLSGNPETPEWKRLLLGGHDTAAEAVESMWTRLDAKRLVAEMASAPAKLTGPQAKRARQKANRAAKVGAPA